ncbi:hypothetical protein [Brevundimonas vesicularis]|uniref:hypothetical protein n=1 Tax=Brevundimonas vesicularis TaxID=41276 RepID=UPI0028AAA992|nr:hypothetical protein [Brevundimonas vesicularis]
MKTITSLLGGAAVLAMTLTASVAAAQTSNVNVTTNSSRGGSNPVTTYTVRGQNSNGTATASTLELNDAQTNSWRITGFVPADCVLFTGGGNGSQQVIDLGEIGVEGQSNLGSDTVFDLRDNIVLTIASGTAGCNTANTMSITKTNGVRGLVNSAPGAFDSNQFQANIPYSVTATFQAGGETNLTVASGDDAEQKTLGAWRSGLSMRFFAGKPGKGLVAGTYEDVITVRFDTDI